MKAKRLGDLLHAQLPYREPADPWWIETRQFLESTYRQLEWSVTGELLGPPLRDPHGHVSFHAVIPANSPLADFTTGRRIRVEVECFEPSGDPGTP